MRERKRQRQKDVELGIGREREREGERDGMDEEKERMERDLQADAETGEADRWMDGKGRMPGKQEKHAYINDVSLASHV